MGRKDITQRLRDYARDYTTTTYHDDLIREAVTEVESLRQQLATLKAELKTISKAIDDPRTDLTMTVSEVIAELRKQLADLLDWQQKAFAACPNIDTLIATNKVLG